MAIILTQPLAAPDLPARADRDRVRRLFPTDLVSQRAIDRKYDRRASDPWGPHKLDQLTTATAALIKAARGRPATLIDPHWLTGGASKVQMAFGLPADDGSVTELLVRLDPAETLNATTKSSEFAVLRRVRDVLPVPGALWVDDEAEYLPEPGLVCTMMPGVARPKLATTGQVSGLGTNFGPLLRAALAPQFAEHLARLHRLDVSAWNEPALPCPSTGTTESALWRLNFERQLWTLDRLEESPLMQLAGQWLARNAPFLDTVSLVHGDYRSGNFLFDESRGTITAWLDWESAHLGDRHADLAYATQDLYGHLDDDGSTFLVSGLIPRDEFFAAYEEASGLSVDLERLRWYSVLANYSALVKTLATSLRVARLGRSHQDVLLARLEGTVPTLSRQLASLLQEVL